MAKKYLNYNRKTNVIEINIVKYTAVSQSERNALSSQSTWSNFTGGKAIHLEDTENQLKACHPHRKLKSGETQDGGQWRSVCPGPV